ncbi:unnamed protein product, partial [Gulo gulo]
TAAKGPVPSLENCPSGPDPTRAPGESWGQIKPGPWEKRADANYPSEARIWPSMLSTNHRTHPLRK